MSVAELSQTDIMGARFREGIRAHGGLVVGDPAEDQSILRRASVTRVPVADARPGYIEIDAGEGERVIVITETDGTRHELHPLLTYGAAKKMGYYQKQLPKLQEELDAADDETTYFAVLERANVMEEKIIRLGIPDFPVGLLDRLDTVTLTRLQEAAQRMQRGGDADPNDTSRAGPS